MVSLPRFASDLTAIRAELVRRNHIGTVIEVSFRPSQLINSAGQSKSLTELAGRKVFGFCGIGNPESFERTLRQLGSEVVGFASFPIGGLFNSGATTPSENKVSARLTKPDAEVLKPPPGTLEGVDVPDSPEVSQ